MCVPSIFAAGSFICGPCPPGYIGDGTWCEDIDECVADPNPCPAQCGCVNIPGSYECQGDCGPGWRGSCEEEECEDIDECAEDTHECIPPQTCENTPGSYVCLGECPPGWISDGAKRNICLDVDECLEDNGGCDPLTECINLPGDYDCSPCPPGYSGDGKTGCVDIDECLEDPEICGAHRDCINIPGGYECSDCAPGYRLEDDECVDIDECAEEDMICGLYSSCTNIPGGFLCSPCPSGYEGNPPEIHCTDINECLQTNVCGGHLMSQCINVLGSHICGPAVLPGTLRLDGGNVPSEYPLELPGVSGLPVLAWSIYPGESGEETPEIQDVFLGPPQHPQIWTCEDFDITGQTEMNCEPPTVAGRPLRFSLRWCVDRITSVHPEDGSPDTRVRECWTSHPGTDSLGTPGPLLTPGSLDFADGVGGGLVDGVLPARNALGDEIQIQGSNFHPDRRAMRVTFGPSGQEDVYPCYVDESETTESVLRCLTYAATGINLYFRVTHVFGGESATSLDRYSYPDRPEIARVSGCDPNQGQEDPMTTGCPTRGGIPITIEVCFRSFELGILVDGFFFLQ